MPSEESICLDDNLEEIIDTSTAPTICMESVSVCIWSNNEDPDDSTQEGYSSSEESMEEELQNVFDDTGKEEYLFDDTGEDVTGNYAGYDYPWEVIRHYL